MVEIKPDEISAILRQQLTNFNAEADLEEIGTVLQVGDGIARVYGLSNVGSGELVEFENGVRAIALNLEEDNVGVVLMGETGDIQEGAKVRRTGKIASIQVGEGMLGRVVNTLGEPIDGKGPLAGQRYEMPIERKAPGVIFREPVKEPLQTGIKAIDAMIPIGRGQRELIIGDRQTGKTAIAIDTIINQKEFYKAGKPVYCIYVAIGQKASTIAGIMKTLQDAGAMEYTVIVAASASEPAPLQFYAPFAGAAIGVTFVRDDVAKPNLGHKYEKYLPYLLTVFFFILINSMFGLLPGSANVTGNIAFTAVLGVISFIVIMFSSNKHYWGHIINPPVPMGIKPILVPVEILGIFTKPFALIVRLFANMVAGHIIILSFVSLIFIFGGMNKGIGWGFAPVSILFTVFIYLIEILVAFIQAFIFTNLTAVFIGQAFEGGHDDVDGHEDPVII